LEKLGLAKFFPSLALGTYETTLIEMVNKDNLDEIDVPATLAWLKVSANR
jgi:hypothetical protein